MPVPVIASIAGRAAGQLLCEVGTNAACEEIQNVCCDDGETTQEEGKYSPKKNSAEGDNDDSNRTLQAANNNKPKPVDLIPNPQGPATVFAKALSSQESEVIDTIEANEEEKSEDGRLKKTKVHQVKDGEEATIEVR